MVTSIDFAGSFKHLRFDPAVISTGVESSANNENDGVAFNGKMVAAQWGTTATIAVFNAEQPHKFQVNIPLIKGHTGTVYDV